MRKVERVYARLMGSAFADAKAGLGGKLFYAGELDDDGRALIVAANIAGAATLVATTDRTAQKRAVRDGIADFLVNSLDESLRILKNQLRRREAVAVCVGLAREGVEREMEERGVLPDLKRRDLTTAPWHDAVLIWEDAQEEVDFSKTPALVSWRVNSGLPKDLAKLDAIALECLDADDWRARRWLNLAPRYLGRLSDGLRLLDCNREYAARLIEHVRECVERGDIAVAVEICSHFRGQRAEYRFVPGKS